MQDLLLQSFNLLFEPFCHHSHFFHLLVEITLFLTESARNFALFPKLHFDLINIILELGVLQSDFIGLINHLLDDYGINGSLRLILIHPHHILESRYGLLQRLNF